MNYSVSGTDFGLNVAYQLAIETKQQRERIATAALQGLAVSNLTAEHVAVVAVRLADALIAELNK